MSNSRYGSLSPRAIHRALFLQPSSPVAPQLLLNPSTIKEICNAAQKLELGGASSVWCWLFLCTQESGKRPFGHWNDGMMNSQGFHHSISSMMFSPDLVHCPFVPLLLCFFALLLLCSVVAAWSRVHEVCHLLGAQCRPKIGCFQFGTATNQPTNQGTNTINTTPTPTKHNTKTTQAQQPTNRPANQQPTNQQRQAQL